MSVERPVDMTALAACIERHSVELRLIRACYVFDLASGKNPLPVAVYCLHEPTGRVRVTYFSEEGVLQQEIYFPFLLRHFSLGFRPEGEEE